MAVHPIIRLIGFFNVSFAAYFNFLSFLFHLGQRYDNTRSKGLYRQS